MTTRRRPHQTLALVYLDAAICVAGVLMLYLSGFDPNSRLGLFGMVLILGSVSGPLVRFVQAALHRIRRRVGS